MIFRGGKFTAKGFAKGLAKLYRAMKSKGTELPHGKQSLKQLKKHNAGLEDVEITDANIKSFEPFARKYHIDYALKKDSTVEPPKWLVFFKGKDKDTMTQAFNEYVNTTLKREKKPSILEALKNSAEKVMQKELSHEQKKDKGMEL